MRTWLRVSRNLKQKRAIIPSDRLPQCADRGALIISLRQFTKSEHATKTAPDHPAYYVPVLDFDCKGEPEKAQLEALEAAAWLEAEYGLVAGLDTLVCPSGSKGAKIFFQHLTSKDQHWPKAWALWTTHLKDRWPTLDINQATVDVTRWAGAQHPKTGRWIVPVNVRRPDWSGQFEPAINDVIEWLPPTGRSSHLGWHQLCVEVYHDWRVDEMIKAPPNPNAKRPSKYSEIDAKYAQQLLEDAGHKIRPRNRHRRFYRCPLCRRRDKAILAGTWIRCVRDSCQAHAPLTGAGGLGPREWSKLLGLTWHPPRDGKKRKSPFELVDRGPQDLDDVEGARLKLADLVERALETPGSSTVIAATPGLGKTRETLIQIADRCLRHDERWAFATPTRAVADEVADELRQRSWALEIERLEPRNEQNCYYIDRVMAATSRGWTPGHSYCAKCQARSECQYYRRRHRAIEADVIVGPWESVLELAPRKSLGKLTGIIVDEIPLRQLIRKYDVVGADLLSWAGAGFPALHQAGEALYRVLSRVTSHRPAMGRWPNNLFGPALAEAFRRELGDGLVADALRQANDISRPAGWLADKPTSEIIKAPSRTAVLAIRLAALLAVEHGEKARPIQISVPFAGSPILRIGEMNQWMAAPRLVLDAYAEDPVYQRILGEHTIERIEATQAAEYHWMPSWSSRALIAKNRGRAEDQLRDAYGWILAQGARRPLILCHNSERSFVEYICPGAEVRHYYAGWGTNAHLGCDAVLAWGTPRIRSSDLLLTAQALYESEDPITDGDPRLVSLAEIFTGHEIAQSVHRARPLNHPMPVITLTDHDIRYLPEPIMWEDQRVQGVF